MPLGLLHPARLLRIEGAAIFLASALLFLYFREHPLWFGLFILLPDVSLLGYLVGRRTGAAAYNLFHTMAVPLALAGGGLWAGWPMGAPWTVPLALIWSAHIGLDRALGFGLKCGGAFDDTDLRRLEEAGDPA